MEKTKSQERTKAKAKVIGAIPVEGGGVSPEGLLLLLRFLVPLCIILRERKEVKGECVRWWEEGD